MQTTVAISPAHLEPHRFTIREYLTMGKAGILGPEERVELIDGQVVSMSPIGNWHGASVRRLNYLFHAQVVEGVLIDVQNPLEFGEHTQLVPDLALIKATEDPWRANPVGQDCLLVVEVAETSLSTDRVIKAGLYSAYGIPEYWLVDLAGRAVEVYREPKRGEYTSRRVFGPGSVVFCGAVPGVRVPVSDITPPLESEE